VSIGFRLSKKIYPPVCLEQAALAYSSLCSISVSQDTPVERYIEIEISAGVEAEETKVAREFLNYLLDLSLESYLGNTLEAGKELTGGAD
jgi:hypothetical protein